MSIICYNYNDNGNKNKKKGVFNNDKELCVAGN